MLLWCIWYVTFKYLICYIQACHMLHSWMSYVPSYMLHLKMLREAFVLLCLVSMGFTQQSSTIDCATLDFFDHSLMRGLVINPDEPPNHEFSCIVNTDTVDGMLWNRLCKYIYCMQSICLKIICSVQLQIYRSKARQLYVFSEASYKCNIYCRDLSHPPGELERRKFRI